MPVGHTNDSRQLWAEANQGTRGKVACGPYPCAEILAYLAAHPEAESPLLRAYLKKQQGLADTSVGAGG